MPASFPGGMVHFFFFPFSTDNTKVTPSAEFGPELSGAAPRDSVLLLRNCALKSNGHNINHMNYYVLHAAPTCTYSQCLLTDYLSLLEYNYKHYYMCPLRGNICPSRLMQIQQRIHATRGKFERSECALTHAHDWNAASSPCITLKSAFVACAVLYVGLPEQRHVAAQHQHDK